MAQQQILEIAKALLHEARIIVMDEPTASLTPLETRQLFAIIDGLRSHGLGIIYISHRLEEIFRIADRIVVLRDGTKVGERRVNAVDRPGLIAMMVGRPLAGGGPRAAIRRGIALLPEDRKTQGLVLAHSLRDNFGLPNMDWLSTCGFLRPRLERTRFSAYATRLRIRAPAATTLAQAHDGDGQFVNALAAGLEAAGGEVVATARGDAAEAERIFASVKEPIVLGSMILGAVLLDRLKQWAWQRRSGLVDKG
jgi:ABC-type sugar transport system ATPase subunit